MRRDAEFFGDRELDLLYIAKRLKEAQAGEAVLTTAGLDYAVETDTYRGGVIFIAERVGAFFYVAPENFQLATRTLREQGYRPQTAPAEPPAPPAPG